MTEVYYTLKHVMPAYTTLLGASMLRFLGFDDAAAAALGIIQNVVRILLLPNLVSAYTIQ